MKSDVVKGSVHMTKQNYVKLHLYADAFKRGQTVWHDTMLSLFVNVGIIV